MQPLVFFGSDQYSALVLSKLLTTPRIDIRAVVTTRHEPSNPVEKTAKDHNIKYAYYQSNNNELIKYINKETVGLSASFPRLFPPSIINEFNGQLYNLHPSLLPQYRNVAPVPYAISMGDTVTGISIFPVRVGIDNGPLVAQKKHIIKQADTTPTLLSQLFTEGTDLFLQFIENPSDPTLTKDILVYKSKELIFTRKLTRESGYLEWPLLLSLLSHKRIVQSETSNPLIKLRLSHYPDRDSNILRDLIRALEGYEKVWTIAPTRKGDLLLEITSADPAKVKLAGKPKSITWPDFEHYYL